MVAFGERFDKGCEPRFAQPPWTKESAEWKRLDEQLPEDHVARRIVAALELLDLGPLFASYRLGGSDALRPDLMLRLVLIQIWSGRQRPSQWFRDARENIVLRWAGFGICPSRSTWYNFRDRQGEAWEAVPAWMAKTPATRIEQAQRYERARARLQQFQAINERQNPARRRPRGKIVVSATDPESALGLDKQNWLPEEKQYRCPEGHPLKWIGREKRIQADGGIHVLHHYRCSAEHCRGCGRQARCTKNLAHGRTVKRSEHEELIVAHRARMETEEAKGVYRLRKQTVELGYADLKENRQLRRFSGRGLARARIEAGLNELARNLLIIERELRTRGIRNRTPENGYHDTS